MRWRALRTTELVGNSVFENIAKVWLEGRSGLNFDKSVLDELADDLAYILAQVYDAGYSKGYSEGLEENLTELQW